MTGLMSADSFLLALVQGNWSKNIDSYREIVQIFSPVQGNWSIFFLIFDALFHSRKNGYMALWFISGFTFIIVSQTASKNSISCDITNINLSCRFAFIRFFATICIVLWSNPLVGSSRNRIFLKDIILKGPAGRRKRPDP